MNFAKIRLAGGGFVAGAVITMIIGFLLAGWATPGTVEQLNKKAVAKSHAEICVAQFMNDPNYTANLEEFKKVEGPSRIAFVEKGGWDKVPGQKEALADVAQDCTWKIEDILRQ